MVNNMNKPITNSTSGNSYVVSPELKLAKPGDFMAKNTTVVKTIRKNINTSNARIIYLYLINCY